MTTINNDASIKLEQYISDHPDSKTGEMLPLPFRDSRRLFEVFKLPIDMLTYSVGNGRVNVDVLEYRRREKTDIDPQSPEGRKLLMDSLLGQANMEQLVSNIDSNGQVEPGVVTYDGIVINGNRRMAAISKLDMECEKHPVGTHKFLLAAKLPPDVTKEELYQIEADLQFGFDYKEKYGAVNELLKIRSGVELYNDPKTLARIIGKDKSEIEKKLQVLQIIDDYLARIGHPGEYRLIEDAEKYSHFAEIPEILKTLSDMGKKDEVMERYLTAAYVMIKNGLGHREVRKLKSKVCNLPEAMENRVLDLADSEILKMPASEELEKKIEDRMDEADIYILQARQANAPLEIVSDMIARAEMLQPRKGAAYSEELLKRLRTLQEKIAKKIAQLGD